MLIRIEGIEPDRGFPRARHVAKRRRGAAAVRAVACALWSALALCAAGSGRAAIQTQHVVIVTIDGGRYSETLGHPNLAYHPRIGVDLAAIGAQPALFQNVGVTNTNPGHCAIVTGTLQPVANDGSERPHLPTVFEYLRQQKGTAQDLTRIILRKPKLDVLAYSDHPSYGAAYGAHVTAGLNTDLSVFLTARTEILQYKPVLTLVHFGDPDIVAHSGDWPGYLTALRLADSLTWRLWNDIQADPVMGGKTTLFISNDHGRHDDAHGGFQNHGDTCAGCRRIMLLMAGPDNFAGHVSAGVHDQRAIARTAAHLLGVTMPLAAGRVLDDLLLEPSAPFVGVGSAPLARLALEVYPNPTRSGAVVRLAGPGAERARLEVIDAGGRRVVSIAAPVNARDLLAWRWDGRDARGREVPPGRYVVRAVAGDVEGRATLVKLR